MECSPAIQSFYSTRARGSGEAPDSRVTWLSREFYLISVHLVVVNVLDALTFARNELRDVFEPTVTP
jgi:hypothetical protein